jgi:hypothetical protein
MHFAGRFDESLLETAGPIYQNQSKDYSVASIVDRTNGSVPTELNVNQLLVQGAIEAATPHA